MANHEGIEALRVALQKTYDALGEAGAAIMAIEMELVTEADVTDGERDLGQQAAEQNAAGQNPPSWVMNEDAWGKAKEAASKTYSEADAAYWPIVVHIYKRMGGWIA